MLNSIMQNIYSIGFILAIVCILASVFYKYLSIAILAAFPFGKELFLSVGLLLAVMCSFQLGKINQTKLYNAQAELAQAKVDVKTEAAVVLTDVVQANTQKSIETTTNNTKVQVQKVYVDRVKINNECKIDNSTIDILNNAIAK